MGGNSSTFPRVPRTVPPPHSRPRRHQLPSYLRPERASASPTAAASWSGAWRRRRGSDHFGCSGSWTPAPGAGGGGQRDSTGQGLPASGCDPAEELCGRGTSVCSESVRSSTQPLYARQADQSRTACSSRGRLSALWQRAAGNKAPGKAVEAPPHPAPPPPLPLPRRAGPQALPGSRQSPRRTRRRSHFWDQARAAVAGVWV